MASNILYEGNDFPDNPYAPKLKQLEKEIEYRVFANLPYLYLEEEYNDCLRKFAFWNSLFGVKEEGLKCS